MIELCLFFGGTLSGLLLALFIAAWRRVLRSLRSPGVAFVPGATYRLHSGQVLQVKQSPTWWGIVQYTVDDAPYEAPATDLTASVRNGAHLEASGYYRGEPGDLALTAGGGR